MSAVDDVIAVVDDCEVVRDALDQFLVSAGCRTELYASAEEFMQAATATRAACLVVRQPSAVRRDRSCCVTCRRAGCVFPRS